MAAKDRDRLVLERSPRRRFLERREVGVLLIVSAFPTLIAAIVLSKTDSIDLAPYVPFHGVLTLLCVAFLAVGWSLRRNRKRHDGREPLNVLSWWWVLSGLLLIVVSMWGATAVLLYIADAAAPDRRVELRLDAVKTGLTVGAGAAGAVALLLGVRRQWLGERTQSHQEYDAAEKRVTELYVKAVDQLGNESAAVRMGGLYALERVAQDNPAHRQTVVDVICAYLRMPPIVDRARHEVEVSAGESHSTSRHGLDPQDRQVRMGAQRILAKHLRRGNADSALSHDFWPDLDLDLTGAELARLDLSFCRVRNLRLPEATIEGGAKFHQATFEGVADFWGARFRGGADFSGAVFAGTADFDGAEFEGGAVFWAPAFDGVADFEETMFKIDRETNRVWPSGWVEGPELGRKPGYGRLIREESLNGANGSLGPEHPGAALGSHPDVRLE